MRSWARISLFYFILWSALPSLILTFCSVTPPCRVWLQHSCCPAHHGGLHAWYLPHLLQLLPGDLHAHPAAVCGPGSGNPLRRRTPAPHSTGIGHRTTAPSSVTVSQESHMYKETLFWRWSKRLIVFLFVSFGDPWSPWRHSQSWWWALYRRKGVSVEDSGHHRWDIRLFPYWKDLLVFSPFSWPRKTLVFCSPYQLMMQKLIL